MNEQHKQYSDIIKKVLDPTGQRTAKVCLTPYMYDNALNRASTDKLTSFKSGEIATIMPCFERTQ